MTFEHQPYAQFGRVTDYANGVSARLAHVNDEPAVQIVRNRCSFVICLSAAHKYTDDRYLLMQAMKSCEMLGLNPGNRSDVKNMADIFLHQLDDLVSAPPAIDTTRERLIDDQERYGMIAMVDGKELDIIH